MNSSREHPLRAFEKLFKCPALRAIFVGKCPAPRSFCGGQMPGPPVHPINIQSYWLPYFNKHNCFSAIELHKTGHELSHFDWKTTKQMVLLPYRSFMVDKCSSTPKWLLETLDSERRRKWRQDVTKQVCCCLQMPGEGSRDTINCQMPVLRDSSWNKCPGFAPGGGGSSRLELTRTWFLLLSFEMWEHFF